MIEHEDLEKMLITVRAQEEINYIHSVITGGSHEGEQEGSRAQTSEDAHLQREIQETTRESKVYTERILQAHLKPENVHKEWSMGDCITHLSLNLQTSTYKIRHWKYGA
jgi:hypothetical protein